ncbi:kinase-like domain-containing protein, partial [Mycena maculata]
NVLVDKRGAPCICDFGISKIISRRGFTTSSVGTAPYMAPELFLVIDNETSERETSPCTPKSSDVYSFALLVLEVRDPLSYHLTLMGEQRNQILTSEPPKGRPRGQIVTARLLEALHPNRADYDVHKVTNTIWLVLDRCWAFYPQLRLTTTEVLPLLRPQTWAPEGSPGSVPR